MQIKIGDKLVGNKSPILIVAEAGVNHNGNINLAKKLVDAAVEAGADAVKFQTFNAENIVTISAEKAKYQRERTGSEKPQYDMLKKLELTAEEFIELAKYSRKRGIIFLSSPFDENSVDLLDEIGVPAFKIPSGEITNFPLLKYIAKKGKPVILSTGMSTLEEVREALKVIKNNGSNDVILLHCVTGYPSKVKDMNLRVMETLKTTFGLPIGLSDHTLGTTIPTASVALGAVLLEKHFTLDKNFIGPDHKASLDPKELSGMVLAIRDVETALGNGIKKITQEEEEIKAVLRKSIVAKVDITKGAIIQEDMLIIKRPASGLEPKFIAIIVGRKTTHNIRKDEPISWEAIGEKS
jgi:N-acetylneuraminate synthase/N,N'-diacetyllegionaminate synthase|tara:strand:+ start:28786 stop:29841 length:1056 start_codon:yes stop_codon:yes gene_type:complete